MVDRGLEILIIQWDELADYKARGLQVIEIEQEPDAETLASVSMPDELYQTILAKQKVKSMKLKDVIQQLVKRAQEKQGQVQRTRLSGGLGIDLIYGIDGQCQLQLWREGDKGPSWAEWKILLAAWDGAPADVKPEELSYKGKKYLRGSWAAEQGNGHEKQE